MLGNPSSEWFSPYGLFRSEPNPTQGYSDRELSSLIKIINSFFRQVSKQIMENPSIHLNASTNKRTATFTYNNHTHEIASPITKCFSAAYFMLSYYTWGNTTVLLNMTKPKEKIFDGGKWFEQSVLKPRQISMYLYRLGITVHFMFPK